MSQKPLIFISHITEESELAKMLAAFIKKTYLNMFDVFVSSDGENISSGDRWLESIDNALGSCVIQVSLCSPYSVTRPWINFEAGASWIGPYISIHFLSLNPLLVRRRRYSRGERYPSALCGCHSL